MSEATNDLDQLVKRLEAAVTTNAMARRGDAIERVLSEPARTTGVQVLRNAPEIEAFRTELADGLIRADTANQLLRLVSMIVERML
jgi:hypothetical protein